MTARPEVHEQGTALDRREGSALVPEGATETVETAATAVAAREKAAVEARFLMAIQRPRSYDHARQRILDACRRPRFAQTVQYAKPIGRNKVTGLSIRFAEEAARNWGNLDIQTTIVFDDRERRIYRVSGTDLETNYTQPQDVMVEKFVERRTVKQGDEVLGRRTNSRGDTVYLKAATEDEILVKANAQLAKARRNIILALIPSDIREEAEELALETVRDQDAADPAAARKLIVDNFYRLGVSVEQLEGVLGHSLQQVNPAELQLLRTIYQGLRDGEVSWSEIEDDETLAKMRDRSRGDKKEKGSKKGTAGLKNAVADDDDGYDPGLTEEEKAAEKARRERGK